MEDSPGNCVSRVKGSRQISKCYNVHRKSLFEEKWTELRNKTKTKQKNLLERSTGLY